MCLFKCVQLNETQLNSVQEKCFEVKRFYDCYAMLITKLKIKVVRLAHLFCFAFDEFIQTWDLSQRPSASKENKRYKILTKFLKNLFTVKNDTQCSYYYLPIWIIFVINQTFFTLIAIKIRRSYGSNGGSQRHAECLMNSAELRQSKMNDEDK